jgi:hypothetical protein
MTTVAAEWVVPGSDIHVMSGETSLDMKTFLGFRQDDGDVVGTAPDVTKIEFFGRFAGAPNNFGVSVNKNTGEVTVTKPLPGPPRLRNFMLEAVVTVGATKLPALPIRVHVHASVKEAWLTPDKLTLHRNANGQRFTLLAKFDDDVVGYVWLLPGAVWSATPASAVSFDPIGGMTSNANTGTATVKATLPAEWGSKVATAEVELAPPWSAELVPVLAPRGPMSDVPNILVLPEGFTANDRGDFDFLVDSLVEAIRSSRYTRPYDILPVNFWKLWVESEEPGLTYLNSVWIDGSFDGHEFEESTAPDSLGGNYSYPELTYVVGMPIPADATATRAAKEAEWNQLFAGTFDATRLTGDTFTWWTRLAGYQLLNERNTAFGLAQGGRPRVERPANSVEMTWNPSRATRTHLDQLIDGLKDGAGNPMPTGWKKGPATGAPPLWVKGRDRPLVFMLCAGAHYGGSRTPPPEELIASSLDSSIKLVLQGRTLPKSGVDLDPVDIPSSVWVTTANTFAHEMSHAFGLSDEYGDGFRGLPDFMAPGLEFNGNLQPKVDLEDTNTGDLDPVKLKNDIKWLFPRIENAGVLTKAPTAAGSEFVVTLGKGQAETFAKDDVVRLRRRPLLQFPQASPRLQITQAPNAGTGEVRVKTLEAGFNSALFGAGSVLIRPRRPPNGPNGQLKDDYLLIAPIIHQHLQTTKSPLNRASGDACEPGPPAQMPVNLPTGLQPGRPRWLKTIIGIYDGGRGFSCNVFHPTGACLMRDNTGAMSEDYDFTSIAYPLCHVCRYLLVDMIDPTKHGDIDNRYQVNWPEP